MAYCVYCGNQNITDAAFCSACGKPLASPPSAKDDSPPGEPLAPVEHPSEPQAPQPAVNSPRPPGAPNDPPVDVPTAGVIGSASVVQVSAAAEPPMGTFNKAKRPLFRKPLARDWTFWLFVVLAAIGSVQTVYRTGSGYGNWTVGAIVIGGAIDILIPLAFSFLVFAVIPAFIRKLVLLPRDKKALREAPTDLTPAWHPDPLKLSEHRWWDGTKWTNATAPQPSKKARWLAPAVVVVLVVEMLIVFSAGLATGTANGGSSSGGSGGSSAQSNAALMVNASFLGLADAVQKYNSIRIDPNAPLANITEVKAAFDTIETNYMELGGALPAVKSQNELGFGAPNIDKLKALVTALGPFIQTRKDYYAGLEACGPLTDGRQPTMCDESVFAKSEKPMVDSIPPVATAWEAVIASMPDTSN